MHASGRPGRDLRGGRREAKSPTRMYEVRIPESAAAGQWPGVQVEDVLPAQGIAQVLLGQEPQRVAGLHNDPAGRPDLRRFASLVRQSIRIRDRITIGDAGFRTRPRPGFAADVGHGWSVRRRHGVRGPCTSSGGSIERLYRSWGLIPRGGIGHWNRERHRWPEWRPGYPLDGEHFSEEPMRQR